MEAVVAAFNQEKALVGAFSVITNLRMELFEALVPRVTCPVSTCVCRWLARQDLDRERIILGVEAGPGTNTTLGDQFYACAVGDIGRYNQCKQEFFQNLDLKLER